MKIEVKEDIVFAPIEITITIENPEELCDLWHRLNINPTPNFVTKQIIYSDLKTLKHPPLLENQLLGSVNELIKKHKLYKTQ